MKRIKCAFCLMLLLLLPTLMGCNTMESAYIDVTKHGVLPTNSGKENSENLQKLIDQLSSKGGTLYIPGGEYLFAENGTQTIGSHCIKMRSNVNILGDGAKTVLKPVGNSKYGLDMFYFNEYLDQNVPVYLENCTFQGFVIDAAGTSCQTYTSAGKGFMLNLVKNCHWENVIVRNTDATGFGMDCPIDCTIFRCTAINCGKAATWDNGGASGFGIGFGYAENESIVITDCDARYNKKFGIFFEHQGRFDESRYQAEQVAGFTVKTCNAAGNYANFGCIQGMNVVYENCNSSAALQYGFLFENSVDAMIKSCSSTDELEASFAIFQKEVQRGIHYTRNVSILQCSSTNVRTGVLTINEICERTLSDFAVRECAFSQTDTAVFMSGMMDHVTVVGNHSSGGENYFDPNIRNFVHTGNSWN